MGSLAAASLMLAGCKWGKYFPVSGHPGPQPHIVVASEQKSLEFIYVCSNGNPGPFSRDRAKCVLNGFRYLCHGVPIGWSSEQCLLATDHQSNSSCNRVAGDPDNGVPENCAESMVRAITAVLGDKECLGYEYHAYFGPSNGWLGFDYGDPGCPS